MLVVLWQSPPSGSNEEATSWVDESVMLVLHPEVMHMYYQILRVSRQARKSSITMGESSFSVRFVIVLLNSAFLQLQKTWLRLFWKCQCWDVVSWNQRCFGKSTELVRCQFPNVQVVVKALSYQEDEVGQMVKTVLKREVPGDLIWQQMLMAKCTT